MQDATRRDEAVERCFLLVYPLVLPYARLECDGGKRPRQHGHPLLRWGLPAARADRSCSAARMQATPTWLDGERRRER